MDTKLIGNFCDYTIILIMLKWPSQLCLSASDRKDF
jgi:hypothetical protein